MILSNLPFDHPSSPYQPSLPDSFDHQTNDRDRLIENLPKAAAGSDPDKIAQNLAFDNFENTAPKALLGCLFGTMGALLYTTTGLETYMHEVLGHVKLGLELTTNFPEGKEPTWQVDGFDNFKAIWKAQSIAEGFKEFGRWITGYDRNEDGASGVTRYWTGMPNTALGDAMGEEGKKAWISIAGSIPGLAINTLLVGSGMGMRKKCPILGYLMLTFGFTQHMMNSGYSISAAAMSKESMVINAAHGHDFANFSLRMGEMTGIDPKTIAIGTATVWTAFVPLVALGIFLYQQTHKNTDSIPDQLALTSWLSKMGEDPEIQKKVTSSLEKYPRIGSLENCFKAFTKNTSPHTVKAFRLEMRRFSAYLIQNLPRKTLEHEKIKILKEWDKTQAPNKVKTALTALSVTGSVTHVAAQALHVLGQTVVPVLSTAGQVLTYASPIFSVVSVISSGYETYHDLKSTLIPKKAKMISVAKLVVSIVLAIGLTVGLFIPGVNIGIVIGIMLAGALVQISLSIAKHRVIKHRFDLHHAKSAPQWEEMIDLLEIHKQDRGTVEVKNDQDYGHLYHWIKKIKEARKLNLLSQEQIEQLETLNPL